MAAAVGEDWTELGPQTSRHALKAEGRRSASNSRLAAVVVAATGSIDSKGSGILLLLPPYYLHHGTTIMISVDYLLLLDRDNLHDSIPTPSIHLSSNEASVAHS